MKYKLLKPIRGLNIKVGEEIDKDTETARFNPIGIIQLLIDGGYIEEYDPDKKWEPKHGEYYYYVNSHFEVCDSIFLSNGHYNSNLIGSRNYFKTREEAEVACNKIREFMSSGNGMK